ncbi:MAG TPA: hypothetical protein G4O03_00020 [Dehalococcoidia bacterium]|nr:hypothetical protein [Dehalococcoidia bacterium]
MDFALNEQQRMIQSLARDFAEKTLRPRAREIDRTSEWPADIVEGLAKLGFLGLPYPQEYGGAGADYLSYVLAVEEMSRVAMVGGALIAIGALSEEALFTFGTEEQKRQHLPPLLRGEHMGIFAFTEPGTGSDPRAITSVAKPDGDSYLISGEKTFASLAPGAKVAVIFAKDETEQVTAFIVDPLAPGFTIGKHWETMGLRGSGTSPSSWPMSGCRRRISWARRGGASTSCSTPSMWGS